MPGARDQQGGLGGCEQAERDENGPVASLPRVISEFDRDTHVEPAADGSYGAELGTGWVVGGGVNGGYLLATIGRAIAETVPDRPDPIAISAYYLSASTPGSANVATRVLRDGGSVATVAADLAQDGSDRITVLATYGDLSELPDDVGTTAEPPDLPPLDQCVGFADAPPEFRDQAPPLMSRFDMRFDAASAGWAVGAPSGRGLIQCWFRLPDHEPDPLALLLAVDAMPPATFDLGLFGWAPTLELTVHVRARPAAGWLHLRHSTRNVAGGMFEEDCEVWDSTGRLVAQSRQLARQPRPQPLGG